ncbi:hypothetical protein [Caulobacter sp. NIBR2454]|uniref:hypothetical protein n=1 Tax=Caulobacter sp. NIBR2454 TaxID=3015996 RepID=UPI0022B5FB65|nr:hypothetical protein [Caulobacter sp. NIBR2454]
MNEGRTSTITHLADHRDSPLPEAPTFFASRVVSEDRQTRLVEYCAMDMAGGVKLMVTVGWNADPLHPGVWTPTSSALAAVLLIDQVLDHERVVVAHQLDDEVMQPFRPEARDLELIEMRELLGRRDLRFSAPDLDDQIALLRFDPTRPNSAYGDAMLLKTCWTFIDGHLRKGPPIMGATRPAPMATLSSSSTIAMPRRTQVPGWFWGLGAAIAFQILALTAPWVFSGG